MLISYFCSEWCRGATDYLSNLSIDFGKVETFRLILGSILILSRILDLRMLISFGLKSVYNSGLSVS